MAILFDIIINLFSSRPQSLYAAPVTLMAILSLPADHQEQCHVVFKVFAKEVQLMVVMHIGRSEDCILIAGCGWGKSLVYFLPLALWRDRTIVVVSPLLALMHEQQEKLQAYGFKSICLDGSQELDARLLRRLDNGEFRAVFMTPETILSIGKSSGRGVTPMDRLRGMSGWRHRLQAIVIDETHCVSSWARTSARLMLVLASSVK
jgi:superfamily II DNA helicase RecQ